MVEVEVETELTYEMIDINESEGKGGKERNLDVIKRWATKLMRLHALIQDDENEDDNGKLNELRNGVVSILKSVNSSRVKSEKLHLR